VPTTRVSPEFFATLGAPLAMGRAFTEEETSYGAERVAVLTDAFWRQRLNADPNVLGRTIRVNGGPVTVIGVLGPDSSSSRRRRRSTCRWRRTPKSDRRGSDIPAIPT
jgi:hypothetical protein